MWERAPACRDRCGCRDATDTWALDFGSSRLGSGKGQHFLWGGRRRRKIDGEESGKTLPGRLRCLSPTPFPHGFGKDAMLQSATCRHWVLQSSLGNLGLGLASSSPSVCPLMQRAVQCQPIATRFPLPDCGNARGVAAEKTSSEVGYDVCSKHGYLGTCNLGRETGR